MTHRTQVDSEDYVSFPSEQKKKVLHWGEQQPMQPNKHWMTTKHVMSTPQFDHSWFVLSQGADSSSSSSSNATIDAIVISPSPPISLSLSLFLSIAHHYYHYHN